MAEGEPRLIFVDCTCERWKRGSGALNAAVKIAQVHGFVYEYVPMEFCPWCGAQLRPYEAPDPTPPLLGTMPDRPS